MELSLNLGYTNSGRPVTWKGGDNPHISISGRSGSGKSFFIKRLLNQAVQQNALCIVFDYSGDFREWSAPDNIRFRRIDVTSSEFSINPLISTSGNSTDMRAQQLLSLLHSVFRMGPRASLALQRCTRDYLDCATDVPSLDGLLAYGSSAGNVSSSLRDALAPLDLLTTLIRCGGTPISLDFSIPGIMVLDFEKLIDNNSRKILIEVILQTIWGKRTSCWPSSDCPIILVLDESQNLSWSENSMAVRILREGRKFDIAGWFSSQWIDNKTAISALSQAALQAHFRPDDENTDRLIKKIYHKKADRIKYQRMVSSLKRGQFLRLLPDGRPIVVHVESERHS